MRLKTRCSRISYRVRSYLLKRKSSSDPPSPFVLGGMCQAIIHTTRWSPYRAAHVSQGVGLNTQNPLWGAVHNPPLLSFPSEPGLIDCDWRLNFTCDCLNDRWLTDDNRWFGLLNSWREAGRVDQWGERRRWRRRWSTVRSKQAAAVMMEAGKQMSLTLFIHLPPFLCHSLSPFNGTPLSLCFSFSHSAFSSNSLRKNAKHRIFPAP